MASYRIRGGKISRMTVSDYRNSTAGTQKFMPVAGGVMQQSVGDTYIKQEPNDDSDEDAVSPDSAARKSGAENRFSSMSSVVRTEASAISRRGRVAHSAAASQARNQVQAREWVQRGRHRKKFMTLDKIWALNDKQLVALFAEPAANELTKNFAYTCALMPETCAAIFTSFGSELKARTAVKEHLLDHLRELVSRARVDKNFTFCAQTVKMRKKNKMTVSGGVRGRRKKMVPPSHGPPRPLVTEAHSSNDLVDPLSDEENIRASFQTELHSPFPEVAHNKSSDTEVFIKPEPVDDIEDSTSLDRSGLPDQLCEHSYSYTDHIGLQSCDQQRTGQAVEEEPLSRTSGCRVAADDVCSSKEGSQGISVVVRMRKKCAPPVTNHLIIPVVRVARSALVEKDVIECADNEMDIVHNTPDRHVISTVDMSLEEALYTESNDPLPRFPIRRRSQHNTSELERRLAMRYIRELQGRKRDDGELVCKICRTKVFTAMATLLYHYRSHAGIKPFVCLICNTTFTRQHSLNYHMLIHKNLNRFTCKECGRMFRHPSHYKEHLRRHTGETPFHCEDCPMKFKTRNTYKRHLRTRHGKELCADGVRLMPREQFLLVRTKPYLHDDQTTPAHVLRRLLAQQQIAPDADALVNLEDTSQQNPADGYIFYEVAPGTGCDDAKLVPV